MENGTPFARKETQGPCQYSRSGLMCEQSTLVYVKSKVLKRMLSPKCKSLIHVYAVLIIDRVSGNVEFAEGESWFFSRVRL